MQSKENLKTGSMMSLDDAERDVKIENRETNGKVWCMAVGRINRNVNQSLKLKGINGMTFNLYRFYRLDRRERLQMEMEAKMHNCEIVVLPPGITPKDLDVQGR